MPVLLQVLEQSARDHPNRVAVSIVGGSALTYHELHVRVERFATWLKRRGITAGDRVAVLSNNGLTMFDAFLGSARIGAAVVPIGTGLARLQVEMLLADAEPALVIVERPYGDDVAAFGIDVLVSDSPEYAKALATEPEILPYPSPQSTALIIYTSGTTGTAKGVCLTQDALVYNARVSARSQGLSGRDVYLSATPMYHASAGLRIYTTLLDAQTHVVMPSFDADVWLDVVETYGVTATIAVPTQIRRVLDRPSFSPERLTSMRLLIYGAAPTAQPLVARMLETLPCGLYQGYGLTEACAVATALTPQDHVDAGPGGARLASCGRPIEGVDLQLVDLDGQPVAAGEVGQILLRSRKLMTGYWRRPRDTQEAIRDGWLHTGDLARHDEEGYVYIAGRSKEVIISGGVNIYPAEVERAIGAHPAVAEVAVFGFPDEEWGESTAATVRLHPGAVLTDPEVRDLVEEQLGKHMRPRRVAFVADFPRTSTGKIQRTQLAEKLASVGDGPAPVPTDRSVE